MFEIFIFGILIIPFSLGLVERDGVLIIVGYIGAIIYLELLFI
ncbi:exopolysaccharide biosynthesis protein [Coxiella-like endosymbiont of Rhipicephalus sanguineus]|nr:exopolysaccharide biosynthesis protein [Coxiella-like endosymbiont of Rhipicephalus sanguineus]